MSDREAHPPQSTSIGSDVTALEKHGCPACGAQATWNAKTHELQCSYCGTVSPYEIDDSGEIREIDLIATLRSMPESLRGWKMERRTVKCRSCRAISVFDPSSVGQNCDFCGSAALVDYQEIKSPLRPQSVLPFKQPESKVRERMRQWFKERWFAPGALKRRAMVDTVKGVYLPYWTFDAQVECPWTAESGTYYYTTRKVRGSDGKLRTQRVRHTRWSNARGHVSHFFDDTPVPGTQGVDLKLLRAIEPFPTSELVPYDTAYLSGFLVEHYQVVLVEAAKRGRDAMNQELRRMCASQVPGDTYRNLRISPQYQGETFKHMLVPVWLLAYNYGPKSYQVLVNGYTGEIAGHYPKSFWKIAGVVLLALIAAVIVFIFTR